MKNLLKKIFKIETPVNYIIAEYKPIKKNSRITDVEITEYEPAPASNQDEMAIDKIYEKN
jgi:hypothetical protein